MKKIALFVILGFLFSCQAKTLKDAKICNLNLSLNAGEYTENGTWTIFLNKLNENGTYSKETYNVTLDKNGNATVPIALGDVNLVLLNFQYKNDLNPWQNSKQFYLKNKSEVSISCLVEDRELKINSKDLNDKNNKALNSFLDQLYKMMREPGAISRKVEDNEKFSKQFMEFTNDFLEKNPSLDESLKTYLKLKGYNYSLIRNIEMARSEVFSGNFYDLYNSQLMFFEYSSPQILKKYINKFESFDGDTQLDILENKIDFVNKNILGSNIKERLIESYLYDFKRTYKFVENNFKSDLEQFKVLAQNLTDVEQRNELITLFEKSGLTEKGANFPSIDFKNLEEKIITSNSLFNDNKYVYIDIWASWCKPCIKEIPVLKELEKEYANKSIKFVSISIDTKPEAWHKALKDHGLHGNQLFDQDNQIGKSLNIQGIPRFLFYSPKGELILIDAPRPSASEIRSVLDKYL